jgi:hypothetical protein
LAQIEVILQFFIGTENADMTYNDDILSIARRNLCSLSGFWFDCVTSIPWSYLDLHFYLVKFLTPLERSNLQQTNTPSFFLTHLSFKFRQESLRNPALQACTPDGTGGSTNSNARVIRAVKILRILRIVRFLKLVKFVT